ncbi:hypothetical protein D3C80_1389950 [compost metagenome]
MGAVHPVVEGARQDHGPQAAPQGVGVQAGIPGADGPTFVVQDADQAEGVIAHLGGRGAHVGAIDGAGGVQLQVAEIRRVAGAARRLRHAQRQGRGVLHNASRPVEPSAFPLGTGHSMSAVC